MKSKTLRLVAIFAIIGVLAFLYWLGFFKYLSLANLQAERRALQEYIDQQYWLSITIFSSVYLVVVLCMLPITLVLNIAAGYFYGLWPATFLCISCAALGATLSMLIFRYLLSSWADRKYADKLVKFKQNFKEHGINYLLALQLLPVTPFPIINISAALSDITAWTFFWTTALGIAPGTAIYTFAGKEFAHLTETDSIMSWKLIILLCLFSLLALVPLLVRRLKLRR